jgi:hypothetical protein
MRGRRIRSIIAALALSAGLAGCKTPADFGEPAAARPGTPRNYEYDGYYKPRSPFFFPKPILALDSARLNKLAREQKLADDQRDLRWFDVRNDQRRGVASGFETATFESVYSDVIDRQSQSHGRVHDHFTQTVRRRSVSDTQR